MGLDREDRIQSMEGKEVEKLVKIESAFTHGEVFIFLPMIIVKVNLP